jgi:putative methionine-R-sulfoxide reductase with GAF domain
MYQIFKNLKIDQILNFVLIVLLFLIGLNYIIGFNPNSYIDEILTTFYVSVMFWLRGLLNESLVVPIQKMKTLSKQIIDGDNIFYPLKEGEGDLAELNKNLYLIAKNLEQIKIFTHKLENQETISDIDNFETEQTIIKSLIQAQKRALIITQVEAKRSWITNGLANFVEILGTEEEFGTKVDIIIDKLVNYVKANQGGIFVLNEDTNEPCLELVACYAYQKKKYLRKILAVDEGLIGQAFQENETIFIKDIPNDYIEITSGLGTANPNYLLLVPLKNNKKAQGVIELALFHPLEPYQVEFVEKLAETLASTIISGKINAQTKKLLIESQKQSMMLKQQEEELVDNVETLQALQEQNIRKQKIYEKQKKELELKLAQIQNRFENLERNYNLLYKNKSYWDYFNQYAEDIIFIIDKAQKIIFFNQNAVKEKFGYLQNIEENLDIKKILPLEYKQTFLLGLQNTLLGNENYLECGWQNNLLAFYFYPLKEKEEINAVLVKIKNITLLKEHQKVLHEMQEKEEYFKKELSTKDDEIIRLKELYRMK